MKKLSKIVSCLVMVSAVMASAAACKEDQKTGQPGQPDVSVWSTYSTSKVGQDSSLNDNFVASDAKLNVSMMKNEVEGSQLIITPEKDVRSFSLKTAQLENENGKQFPLENVDVYQQKYIRVNQKSDFNGVYSIGEYVPDMLLPMDIAEEYKENTIEGGKNQGIYVEFDSTGVEAGTYTGTFSLEIDEKTIDVPVTVNVWDIEYEGRRTFQSCFVLYQSTLLRSEYDNSDEMVNNYIDFFLDYKVNICLHNKRRNNFDAYGQEWLDSVVRNKDNMNYNSIYIPYQFAPTYVAYAGEEPTADTLECVKYVTELAKISTPDYCYIDFAYFYPFELDEADIEASGTRATNAERMLSEGGAVDQMLALAVEMLEEDEEFLALEEKYGKEFSEHVKSSVLNIPTLFTNVTFVGDWVDDYSATFVPYLSVFSNGNAAEHYAAEADKKGNGVWTYTCSGPSYPYPTFHLDDYNLGSRISGWMEKCYGIDGYLYWAVTDDFYHEEWYKYVDPYTDATRYKGADGDGYLVYPGKQYGSDTPFPSLRLVAYRDSMDDYDMLCVYEQLLENYYAEYDLGELNFNDYVDDLYFELFNGAIYYNDDSLVFKVREELAERIRALQNEDGIMYVRSFENGNEKLEVYAKVASLEINGQSFEGEKVAKSGYRFNIGTLGAADGLTVVSENSSVSFPLAKTEMLTVSAEDLTASDGSEVSVDGNAITATLNGKRFGSGLDDLQTLYFTPSISVAVDKADGAENICATIENTSDEAVDLYIKLVVNNMVYELGSTYIEGNGTQTVRLRLTNGATLSQNGELQFYIQNTVKNKYGEYELQKGKSLKITSLRIEYEREN